VFRVGDNWDVVLLWMQPVVPNPTHLHGVDNNQIVAGLPVPK
jgi:hypothetical protein